MRMDLYFLDGFLLDSSGVHTDTNWRLDYAARRNKQQRTKTIKRE